MELAVPAMMFGPQATFLGTPAADLAHRETYADAEVVVLGAPFDGGATHRPGARFGPAAIRTTDYLPANGSRPHLALGVDPLLQQRVVDVGDVLMVPGEIQASLERLAQAVYEICRAGAVPVVLGGDHSIALADISAVGRAHGPENLGLLHFDAHHDTADAQFGSPLGHATSIRRLIDNGTLVGERIVQIGQRNGGTAEGRAWRDEQGIRTYEMSEVERRGLDACLDEAIARIGGRCRVVFLSIDMDAADPAFAPGTGTPEPGGLTSRQLLDAVRRCALELPVVGMEVAELAPPYDGPGQITALLANRLVLEGLAGICRRQQTSVPRTTALRGAFARSPSVEGGRSVVTFPTDQIDLRAEVARHIEEQGFTAEPLPLETLHRRVEEKHQRPVAGRLSPMTTELAGTTPGVRAAYRRLVKYLARCVLGFDVVFEASPPLRVCFPGPLPNVYRSDDGVPLTHHTDTITGDYFEQINCWIPLTWCRGTNSLQMAPLDKSIDILTRFAEGIGFDPETYAFGRRLFYERLRSDRLLREETLASCAPLEIGYGRLVMFDSRIVHATGENREDSTRISIDFRLVPCDEYDRLMRENGALGARRNDTGRRLQKGSFFDDRTAFEL